MTRDRPLNVANGQVWLVINAPVEMSFFASPTTMQRRVSDRPQRQCLKNGEKGSKWSIRRYRGCDVTSMSKVSLYCAICRKYKATIAQKLQERLDHGFDKPENKQLDPSRYYSDVHKAAMAKLKVERSRARGESASTSTTVKRFLSSMDNKTRKRGWRKSSMCAS